MKLSTLYEYYDRPTDQPNNQLTDKPVHMEVSLPRMRVLFLNLEGFITFKKERYLHIEIICISADHIYVSNDNSI